MAIHISQMLIVCVALNSLCLADEAVEDNNSHSAAEQILGKWTQSRETPQGTIRTVKEHRGDFSILTVFAPNGRKVYSHRSEYKIEDTGGALIFRYRNKVILTGPQAGIKDAEEKAYIFRINGDKFYEVHGMLPGDTGKPSLKIWERAEKSEAVTPEV